MVVNEQHRVVLYPSGDEIMMCYVMGGRCGSWKIANCLLLRTQSHTPIITDTNSADYPISITRIKELLPSVALLNSSLALQTLNTHCFEMAMPSDTLF